MEVVNDVIVPDPQSSHASLEALARGRPRWHWKDKFNPDDSLPARLNLLPQVPAALRGTLFHRCLHFLVDEQFVIGEDER